MEQVNILYDNPRIEQRKRLRANGAIAKLLMSIVPNLRRV